MIDRSTVTGVVLAGGQSRRFGPANKLLATVGGRPLLARAVRAVEDATGSVPIVCLAERSDWEDLRHAVADTSPRICTDVSDCDGPVAGVAAAARATETPWLFCAGGDMPTIEEAAVDRLRAKAAGCETLPGAVVPVVDGKLQPLHALYRTESLRTVLDSSSRPHSLRDVIDSLPNTVRVKGGDPLRRSVQNINTKSDLWRVAGEIPQSKQVW